MITKAVLPVAGLGLRFLPATKASPKEMLPIVDKPLVQYAVEEAIVAGIKELIFITNSSKRAIEDHFDSNFELETKLTQMGHIDSLAMLRNILPAGVSCAYIRQSNNLGLGHAISCAYPFVGKEPFAVLLADDLIDSYPTPCLKQMLDLYHKVPTNIVAVQRIAACESDKYGVVGFQDYSGPFSQISHIIEKPRPQEAPSNLAVVGRYILTPAIFAHLAKTPIGQGSEIQLTDAIMSLLAEESVYAWEFTGKRYDCGSKLGYLQATVAYALKHPEIGAPFTDYLKSLE